MAQTVMAEDDDDDRDDAPEAVVPPKPLIGRTIRSKQQVAFEHLAPEMLVGVPDPFLSAAQARVRLFREIEAEIAERRQNPRTFVKNNFTVDIPVFMLTRNAAYQREKVVSMSTLAMLALEWDERGFRALRVAATPVYNPATGELIDATFEVSDGWNRRCAAIELRFRAGVFDFDLPCEVTITQSTKDGAYMFHANNSADAGKQVKSLESFRAGYIAERPDIVETVELADEYGLDASYHDFKKDWPSLPLGPSLRSVLGTPSLGEPVGRRVLTHYANEELIGLRGEKVKGVPHAMSSAMFMGICHFTAWLEKPGFVHNDALVEMFKDPAFMARFGMIFQSMAPDKVKKTVGRNVLRHNDEKQRYWRVAASLCELYKEYVSSPTGRPGRWKACPKEIKALFHTARKLRNPNERKNEVARLQEILSRRNREPYFVVRADRALVR